MGYRIDIDQGGCINCGICMDVCPVEALDMSRPEADGVEGLGPIRGLMEHPVQVGECVGCAICARECPVHVITVATEHKSVLDSCKSLEREGVRVTMLGVDRLGFIDLDELRAQLAEIAGGEPDPDEYVALMRRHFGFAGGELIGRADGHPEGSGSYEEGPVFWEVCVAAAERPSGLRDTIPVGSQLTMRAGSAAQVLLAWEDAERIHRGLQNAAFSAAARCSAPT